MGASKSVVIDLTKQNNSDNVGIGELVQVDAKDRLIKILEANLKDLNVPDTKLPIKTQGNSNVIFINGGRGSGKSTFLKTLMKYATGAEKDSAFSNISDSYAELAYIDPTLNDTSAHIMVSILVKMDRLVRNSIEKHSNYLTDDNSSRYEDWHRKLQRMAKGLSLLNFQGEKQQVTPYERFDEFSEFSEKLSNVDGSLSLSKNFSILVDTALEILQKKSFIIGFDDVDIDFGKGWDILELIRRYIDTPRLVVLITGDLQLYTHLVRGKQFSNFGDILLKNDEDRKEERTEIVDKLEQQYLMKLFPIQNRLTLLSVAELLQNGEAIEIKIPKKRDNAADSETVPIYKYVLELIAEGLSLKGAEKTNLSGDIEKYKKAVLRLPVRTLLQIIYDQIDQSSSTEQGDQINQSSPTEQGKQNTAKTPRNLTPSLRKAMMSSLYKNGIDTESLENGNFAKLIEAVFKLTVSAKDRDLDTGFYLRPQSGDLSYNDVAITLAAEVAEKCYHNPANVIKYMLQALGSVSLYSTNYGNKIDNYLNEFMAYFAVGRDESARHWALHAQSVINQSCLKDNKLLGVGIGSLRCNLRKPKGSLKNSTILNNVIKDKDSENSKALSLCALKSMISYVLLKSNCQFLSIFNLLATIQMLLEITPQKGTTWSDNIKKEIENEITNTIYKNISGNIVTAPSWVNSLDPASEEDNDDDDHHDDSEAPENNANDVIAEHMYTWLKNIHENRLFENTVPSAILIGKVWTRLYFNLGKIVEKFRNTREINKFIDMNCFSLLHSCLCEEFYYHRGCKVNLSKSLSRENPVTSLKTFNNNLSLLTQGKENGQMKEVFKSMPLFTIFATCPLLIPFLKRQLISNDAKNIETIWQGFYNNWENQKDKYDNIDLSNIIITSGKSKPKKGKKTAKNKAASQTSSTDNQVSTRITSNEGTRSEPSTSISPADTTVPEYKK